ncbi:MAG: hypothetical protein ACYC6Y_32050, partial [Thermoguttaceae bacterium]
GGDNAVRWTADDRLPPLSSIRDSSASVRSRRGRGLEDLREEELRERELRLAMPLPSNHVRRDEKIQEER